VGRSPTGNEKDYQISVDIESFNINFLEREKCKTSYSLKLKGLQET
jgi:hypothetical protein